MLAWPALVVVYVYIQYTLVTPGPVPFHLTPGVSDPDQFHHATSILHLLEMDVQMCQTRRSGKKRSKTDKKSLFAHTVRSRYRVGMTLHKLAIRHRF